MSVILQLVVGDPSYYFGPFFDVLGRELGGSFGGWFGNFLGDTLRFGAGLLGGTGGNGGNGGAGLFFGNGGNGGLLGTFVNPL